MTRTDPFGRPLPTPEEEAAFDATRAAFEAAYQAEADAGEPISAGWRPAGGGRRPDLPPPVSAAEEEFVRAMNRYRVENRRPFPTWGEVLLVLDSLGYRRVSEPAGGGGGAAATA